MVGGGYRSSQFECCAVFIDIPLSWHISNNFAKKNINFRKNSPPNLENHKRVKFQDVAHFHYLSSLPYDHFQSTYGHLIFTDLLVTTLNLCEQPTHL